MISVIKKVNPKILYGGIALLLMLALLSKFLFRSIYGLLVLALFCYFYSVELFGVAPMTMRELVVMIVGLDAEYKVGILSSIITVVGFMVAFHVSTESMKKQLREQGKITAAQEIENFFYRVVDLTYVLEQYAEKLIDIYSKSKAGVNSKEVGLWINILQGGTREFIAARDELSKLSSEVYTLINRYNNALSSGFGLKKSANSGAASIGIITSAMWFPFSIEEVSDVEGVERFCSILNIQSLQEFLNIVEREQINISGIAGGIKGYLLSNVWGTTSVGLLDWVGSPRKVIQTIKDFQGK